MEYQAGMTQAFIYRSLIVMIALAGWGFAYKLLSGGLTLQEGEVRFKIFGKIEAKTAKVTSGSVFFVCGTVVLVMALLNPVTVRVSEPSPGAPGTIEIVAQLKAATRGTAELKGLLEKAQSDLASRIDSAVAAVEQARRDQVMATKTVQEAAGTIATLQRRVDEVKKQVEETKQLALGATLAPWLASADKPLKKGDIIYGVSDPKTGDVPAFKVRDPTSLNAFTKTWDSLYTHSLGLEPVKK